MQASKTLTCVAGLCVLRQKEAHCTITSSWRFCCPTEMTASSVIVQAWTCTTDTTPTHNAVPRILHKISDDSNSADLHNGGFSW